MIISQDYRELPGEMFEESRPAPSPSPNMIQLNSGLLGELGVDTDWFNSDQGLAVLAGNDPDELTSPIALAYGGHQFGQWVPRLGDGRAHMLGQLISRESRIDVQLKGSGRTGFSRGGDGRATLGSVIREYIVSEAMAALGIPTTRSLAVITTGEPVMRERAHPGAILVRTATSHIRVGSFQYAAGVGTETVSELANFMIMKHFPDSMDAKNRYQAFLDNVVERQALLVAQWMLAGFIHGVMNTDNTSIVGETIDYGPCAFMDEFHPHKVFSSIDRFGRYAWDQQPAIAHWNLSRFAQTLMPLLHKSPDAAAELADEALDAFAPRFQQAFKEGVSCKLGISASAKGSQEFVQKTFQALADGAIDFTVFFDLLTRVAAGESEDIFLQLFNVRIEGTSWLKEWRVLRETDAVDWAVMRRSNPALIARNHRVEQAIAAAVERQDFAPFRQLCSALRTPFDVASKDAPLQVPPKVSERVTETFCGT